MQRNRVSYLLERYFGNSITAAEEQELNERLAEMETDAPLEDWMKAQWERYQAEGSLAQDEADRIFDRIDAATREENLNTDRKDGNLDEGNLKDELDKNNDNEGRRRGLLGGMLVALPFWSKAAALIALVGAGYLLYMVSGREQPASTLVSGIELVREDVQPGGNYATLTLGDGSQVVLDSASNGLIASQGSARVVKLRNGQIKYETARNAGEVVYNTMSTPIGGQYHLVLPDGTDVWLNAASSITYPTAFVGNERRVSITGEAYFEVARNEAKPFQVKAGDQLIEVLGTHFNVNAYGDEKTLNTTLVEGKVKILTAGESLLLQPGQQAQNNKAGQLKLHQHPDIEETLAWKNGLFYFNGTDIETIMRNVARWYGVEVVYKDKIQEQFVAEIPRDVPVLKLLELLELTKQVRFSVQNRVITVMK